MFGVDEKICEENAVNDRVSIARNKYAAGITVVVSSTASSFGNR